MSQPKEFWRGCNQECDERDRQAVSPDLVKACKSLVRTARSILKRDSPMIITDDIGCRRAWLVSQDGQSHFQICDVRWSLEEIQDDGLSIDEIRTNQERSEQLWHKMTTDDSFPPTPDRCNPHTLFCQKGKSLDQIKELINRLLNAQLISQEDYFSILVLSQAKGFRYI